MCCKEPVAKPIREAPDRFLFFGSSTDINEFCASSRHTSLRSLTARSLLCQEDYEFTSVSQIES